MGFAKNCKGWSNPRGDEHFNFQRERADNAKKREAYRFFQMMKKIGDEMQANTEALAIMSRSPGEVKILDICMAPGGYTASALKYNPRATAFGITLPPKEGGHEVLLRGPRSDVRYLDVTMLAREFDVKIVPSTHPDHALFSNERPYLGHLFDLVFCDGQVLRTHHRLTSESNNEATRLTVSQLIFALQRIRTGGTMIMLLHKIEAWDTLELLYTFQKFSSIQVFKSQKKHAIRSSFYLIAKNVQPELDSAREAVTLWKQCWWRATFGGEDGAGIKKEVGTEAQVKTVLQQFGARFIEIARPVWLTQANALSKAPFVRCD